MTHAITTLDDMELDAVCGGFSFSVGPVTGPTSGSFNPVTLNQKIRQYSSISTGNLSNSGAGGGNTNTVWNDVSQTAMNMGSISL
jgi:hypothetical protein